MTRKELKTLGKLPENELNGRLVSLFSEVWNFHSRGVCLSPFTWENISISAEGTLRLTGVEERPYDNDTRLRNLRDYARMLYCVATGRKSASGMDDEAFGKIDSDVLREIVLTLIGEAGAVTPMIRKLRRPYVDTETFFSDLNPKFRRSEEPEPDEEEKAERRQNRLTRGFFATMAAMMTAAVTGVMVYVNNPGLKPLVTSTFVPEEETICVDTTPEKYYPGPVEYAEAAEEESDDRYAGTVVRIPSKRAGYTSRSVYIPGPKNIKVPTFTIPKRSSFEKINKSLETIRDPKTGRFKTLEDIKLPNIIEAERGKLPEDTAGSN